MRRVREGRDEAGAASVVALALAGALVVVAWGVGSVVATVVAHRAAQNAADLAALAAARDLARGEDGCARAAEIAAANRARLVDCVVEGANVVVEVAAEVHWGIGHQVNARARAGPTT